MSHDVPLIAIPNVSEGRDRNSIDSFVRAVQGYGAAVLDVHSDAVHNRSVITACGEPEALSGAMVTLALHCARSIDLREHEGVHPRVGALDVCPFVPWAADMTTAVITARRTASLIAERAGIPTYLYAQASPEGRHLELPEIRRGGLDGLKKRVADLSPDRGRADAIDDATGVTCVGARDPLVAFNVWVKGETDAVRAIASAVRTPDTLRSLALHMGGGLAQVSMNLIAPDSLSIDAAFTLVEAEAARRGVKIVRTELVGLAFDRHLPDPDAKAARLMSPPGRSFESALEELQASG